MGKDWVKFTRRFDKDGARSIRGLREFGPSASSTGTRPVKTPSILFFCYSAFLLFALAWLGFELSCSSSIQPRLRRGLSLLLSVSVVHSHQVF